MPTINQLKAITEKVFHKASSEKNTAAIQLANSILVTATEVDDPFEELAALNIATVRTFEGFDSASRASLLEKYVDLLRRRVICPNPAP